MTNDYEKVEKFIIANGGTDVRTVSKELNIDIKDVSIIFIKLKENHIEWRLAGQKRVGNPDLTILTK